MELSELSLRVEKLEEIIQALAKWTNFNISTKGGLNNIGWKTTRQKSQNKKKDLKFANVAKLSEISNAVEGNLEDPSSLSHSSLSGVIHSGEQSESVSDVNVTETGPPRKRLKPSTSRKYEPLKVPLKSPLPPSEPFVSLRPLTPSQLPKKQKDQKQKPNALNQKCPQKFKTEIPLSNPIIPRDGRPFACPHCPYAAATKGTLSYHIQARHPATEEETLRRPFKCPECPQTFRIKQLVSTHMNKMHNIKRGTFLCDSCPYVGKNYSSFRKHMNNNHRHLCYFCPWKGKRLDELSTHLRTHTGEKVFDCPRPHCIYTSRKNSILQRHVEAAHSKESFQCPECPCKLKSQTSLERHLQRAHHNAGYKCGICEFVGSNYASLKEHLNCHKTEDGMFQCPHCPKMYKLRQNLVDHVKAHTETTATEQKPSNKCGKDTNANAYRKEKLKREEIKGKNKNKGRKPLTVSRPFAFACPHCAYIAEQKLNLECHIESVHPTAPLPLLYKVKVEIATDGEDGPLRPFHCPQCPETFRFKIDLGKHLSFVHNAKGRISISNNNFRQPTINNKENKEISSFSCYFCPWKGKRLDELSSHLRTHTGEKP